MLLALTLGTGSAADFTQTLSVQEMRDAGLTKLTPAELAKLEALVQHYKAANAATVPSTRPASAEAPVKKSGNLLPDWVGAIITLQKAETAPARAQALEASLAGDFSGWSGRSNFRLDNGQLWAQANNDSYEYSPTLHTPKVKIYPASFGTYWMEIEGVNQRCRVKPVKLE